MNKFEKIYFSGLNLTPSRGRTVTDKITMLLLSMREERNYRSITSFYYGGDVRLFNISNGVISVPVACSVTTAKRLARANYLCAGYGSVNDINTDICLFEYK